MNMTDGELLRRFARDHLETAFEELVKRHIHLIYSAALRQVNGDAHLAEDVTQCVFTDLARKAASLVHHTSLAGWLYTSTRFVAANLRRSELRRGNREQEAHTMNAILNATEPEPDWVQIRPLLDEAMHTLDAADRQAVLWRHFEKRSYAEIGARLGLNENAARMRVDRALAKLHSTLTKQGVTSSALALAGLLAANAVGAAPAHLTARVVSAALTGAATAAGLSALLSQFLTASKTKLAFGVIASALIATLTIMMASRHASNGGSEKSPAAVAATNASATVSATNLSATMVPAKAGVPSKVTNGLVLHLEIVTADTGKPIPMVPIDYRGQAGGNFEVRQIISDRFGKCDVVYPTNIAELELTTRKDDFADTRLLWRPPNGEIIPTNYVLRIDRPVPIGGTVVDADGHPVAGAKVGWNHEDDPANVKLPQSHDFAWIETTTDQAGRWRINRIAEDMLYRIYGSAGHSNYVHSTLLFAGRDKSVEEQLRAGTQVFKLGKSVAAIGIVTDADGTPVAEASILVGIIGRDGNRTGRSLSDGTFSVAGCPPGRQLVTAEAPGFAATSVETDLADNAQPVHLILQPGKLLRLRIVDTAGNPIPNAYIWHDNFEQAPDDAQRPQPVQVDFNPRSDSAGRAALSNAPDVEMKFDVQAAGFMRVFGVSVRPDGEEHTITLNKALTVHGTVVDEATGLRIPQFRIVKGWPEWNPADNSTNAHFVSIGRYWLDFTGGTYRDSFEEPLILGTENRGYILKFIADGYVPLVSRVIGPDEGEVELNVSLHRAATISVALYNPDGRSAAGADIALISPHAILQLGQGGFPHDFSQSAGSLLRADASGTFILQPDAAVTRVIAASPSGYAETTPTALSANPILRLQPWGQLQVNCMSAGQPIVGRHFNVILDVDSADSASCYYTMTPVITDAQGQFTILQIPPGHHDLVRQVPIQANPGGDAWMDGSKTSFEIRPGGSTKLYLGTNNYVVTGKVKWPPGFSRKPGWQVIASLQTSLPVIPPEIRTNQPAREAFTQSAEYKDELKHIQRYQPTLNTDDTLSVDEVQPGNYDFFVGVYSGSGNDITYSVGRESVGLKQIAQGYVKITVPSAPPS
ncbi:MAG TPA: sigma-70 family RNA polymerase sigma factor, partial [Candidatus Acidoferrales bacterium]|nr:sigma-70 family RNA polymerase sigma factor [Candidatus Acidoferrales bacterium]